MPESVAEHTVGGSGSIDSSPVLSTVKAAGSFGAVPTINLRMSLRL